MLSILLDILVPARCAACGNPAGSRDNYLCGNCSGRIPFLTNSCPVCSGELSGGTCTVCAERHWYLTRNITVAEYSGVMKKIIRSLKFNKLQRIHIGLGVIALEEISRHHIVADLITWVPMNSGKKRRRGFNQSELIAKRLSRATGVPCVPLLREKRNMRAQRELGLRDRFLNALNRYAMAPRRHLSGQTILIVDDIFTTGATINECARILRAAGAKQVISLTIARADIKTLEKF
ncbi:MAG: hypothetical protein A2176_01215 [Spirochaetes bacterium RBG_13_51_14]|nr:MAG: hypothetical protein A2176_01215 [Spirochaetes bacterium RBG_13_51_14]